MTKKIEEITATGRRKRAVAAVRLRQGEGKIEVNGKEFTEYFPVEVQQKRALSPLHELELIGNYNLIIRCRGGGIAGQVDAVRLAIARALVAQDEVRRHDLKAEGHLTRDPRKKERKKYGHKKARKSFQFSKR